MTVAVSRRIAVHVLERITRDRAFAAPTLDAEFARSKVDPRDAGLATEIVYGALRSLVALDAAYGRYLARVQGELDAWIRALLRTATYQLLHVASTPARAVVHDSVELAREKRGPHVAGFVNAVLRKVAADRPSAPVSPKTVALPAWLRTALREALGEPRAASFESARVLPPPIGLRVLPHRASRADLMRAIASAQPSAELREGALSERAVLLRRAGDPRSLPGFAEGHFTMQEEGAQVVGLLAAVQAGDCVVDACAGRGGKALLFAELVAPHGRVRALDVHPRKLEQLAQEASRLGLGEMIDTLAVDLSTGTAGLGADADVVVVDAPCTGLGTLHRRPELLLRSGEGDPARLSVEQLAILDRAAQLVRPGGFLLYAVCSPTVEEGAQVAAAFEQARVGFRREFRGPLPKAVQVDADGAVRIGPWCADGRADVDAYQVFSWVRT